MRRSPAAALAAGLLLGLVGLACSSVRPLGGSAGDPALGEVALECAEGWSARLLLDTEGVGVWTVEAFQVFPQYATPEVVALDDRGRAWVLVSYSGKWTPFERVHERSWLGGLAHGDVDPRVPGAELYTGAQNGGLYQLRSHPDGALEARRIGFLPGREVHSLVAGDVDPRSPGAELLAFTRPGGLYRLSPTGEHGAFETEHLMELPARVRQAIVLPALPGSDATAPEIATASRNGEISILRLGADGAQQRVLHAEPVGVGRLALRPGAPEEPLVMYAALDDGRVLRFERSPANDWSHATIYLGPQGLRGVVAGRFHEDPEVESVAVFGYPRRVQLLTRPARDDGGPWRVEDLFEDTDAGHWLAVAELDGRNGTDEILASGYSGRVVMLSRPPGLGRSGIATDVETGR